MTLFLAPEAAAWIWLMGSGGDRSRGVSLAPNLDHKNRQRFAPGRNTGLSGEFVHFRWQ